MRQELTDICISLNWHIPTPKFQYAYFYDDMVDITIAAPDIVTFFDADSVREAKKKLNEEKYAEQRRLAKERKHVRSLIPPKVPTRLSQRLKKTATHKNGQH